MTAIYIIIALAISYFVGTIIFNRKKPKKTNFYNEPIVYWIDGKKMNLDEAKEYYDYQKDVRGRKQMYLLIFDADQQKYIWEGNASIYFDQYVKL